MFSPQVCKCGWHKTKLDLHNTAFNASHVCVHQHSHWVGPCCIHRGRCKFHPTAKIFPTGTLWANTTRDRYPTIGSSCFGGYLPDPTQYETLVRQSLAPDADIPITIDNVGTYKNPHDVLQTFAKSRNLKLTGSISIYTGPRQVVYCVDPVHNAAWLIRTTNEGLPSLIHTVFFAPFQPETIQYVLVVYLSPTHKLRYPFTEVAGTHPHHKRCLTPENSSLIKLLPGYRLTWSLETTSV